MPFRQFSVFIGVGAFCAVIDVGLMQLLILSGAHHVLAATAGFLAGLGANFALHTRITFRSNFTNIIFVKFVAVVLVNYLVTIVFVSASFEIFGSALAGKIVSLPLVAVNGFLLSRHWIYR